VHHVILEIVILAMVAAFLGLRLYSVLGRRAEHEEEVIPQRFERQNETVEAQDNPAAPAQKPGVKMVEANLPAATQTGIRAIASADKDFDLLTFLEGAKSAYGMVLEAFWEGDKETLRELCDDDVYASFEGAIDARNDAGETLDNRLIRIEDASVKFAEMDGPLARISVLFVSDIAAVTRDKDGNVIDGSLDDAIESRDIWTFKRHVDTSQPAWTLDETDQG
jgi:predicted lipid-binding transport protein (Tim44 family)